MQLRDLIVPLEVLASSGSLDVPIRRVVADSRQVGPGDLFVCVRGYRAEGGETLADRHDFIPMAVQNGAAALLVEREVAPMAGVSIVRVADCWSALAAVACRLYGDPSHELCVIGVTGTSGKTSTTYFIDSVLRAAGHSTARIGTIEYRIGDEVRPAPQTTPEAPVLQALLREAAGRGCTAVVMEVSSHALELRRIAGISFDVGVFTNLSQDHLNFHPDLEHYRRAKGRLFEALGDGRKRGVAVVNVDDPAGAYMIGVNCGELLTYGCSTQASVRMHGVSAGLHGVSFTGDTPAGRVAVRLRHLGEYSAYNALAALAVGVSLDVPLETIRQGLEAAPPVPGRFELVDAGQSFVVAVDYAHKPDALARLLESARKLQPRRIITVFGCGGDRDRAKRPVMGRIAAEQSDFVIITSDNPRSEDPAAIIAEVAAGSRTVDPQAWRHVTEPDRRSAIRRAVGMAAENDIVLIAGKGHEPYQLIAGRRLDFDDRDEARRALAELGRTRADPAE